MEFNDEEILNLALEKNEAASEIIYEKYKYIVEIMLKKYYNAALKYNVDLKELEQEAYFALSSALANYRNDKNASIATFISLCIDRRLRKVIKSSSGEKAKLLNNTFSLDYDYDNEGKTLRDLISDNFKSDPLNNLEAREHLEELMQDIKQNLSDTEYEIFNFLINDFDYQTIAQITGKNPKQVDNTIQRVKHKIRDIIKD